MYTIIHVKKDWIVCDGQTKLIKFNRKSVALRIAHSAEKLLRTNEAADKKVKPIPTDKSAIVSSYSGPSGNPETEAFPVDQRFHRPAHRQYQAAHVPTQTTPHARRPSGARARWSAALTAL
jgi:hypothetical protein